LNGVAQRTPDGILLTVEEAFGNCPKFIQRRLPMDTLATARAAEIREGGSLDRRQAALARRADTLFIATPTRNAAPMPRIAAAAEGSSRSPTTAAG